MRRSLKWIFRISAVVALVLGSMWAGSIVFWEPPGPAQTFVYESAMWFNECRTRCPKGTIPFVLQGGVGEKGDEWTCGCMGKK